MPSLLISNTNNEACNHGWILADRITTIDYSTFRIPEPRQRKAASLKLTLQTADEFFNHGIQLIDQGAFSEAAEAFFSSTQLQWIFTAAHIELGNAYSALIQYDKALEAYTNALENDPASLIAHYNIALTYSDLKQHNEALHWVECVIKINPKYQIAYTLLAKLHLATGQPEKALAGSTSVCRKAVEAASSRYPGPRRQRLPATKPERSRLTLLSTCAQIRPLACSRFLFTRLEPIQTGSIHRRKSISRNVVKVLSG